MTRDWDFLREILLRLEDQGDGVNYVFFPPTGQSGVGYPKYFGHIRMLASAGYVEEIVERHADIGVMRITWSGYELIESLRDDETWKKTKSTAIEIKNFGVDTLKQLAKGYLRKKIKEHTDLDIN